ncbi:MAG: raffinose/stachyose/melibiose transport system permease protein [Pseudonocardiales bacterium]|jgi:raffinose/stachyose/melibiose transport system permease protein|nr:raffinose/stachyose/melibiose transport system permease protein [Pseudonocardiales bacterium]
MVWLSRRWQLLLMLAPALLVFSVYLVYPVVYSVFYSFSDYNGVSKPKYVGATNYRAMTHDDVFWSSLRNTMVVLGVALVLLIPLAFLLAVLLSGPIKGAGALRALIFAPAIVAPILVGLIWVFILDPHIGLVNGFLSSLGFAGPQWIGGTSLTPLSVGLVYVWQTLGFVLTIFYAGLKMLPRDVMEASALDGASRWQQLRYVTVPMLQETFGICTVLVITGAFKVFELVYVLTGGGPVHLSDVLVSYMYYVTFRLQNYGYGMALAVVICLLGVVVSLAYLSFLRRRRRA